MFGVFKNNNNKTIIPFAFVGYEMVKVNSYQTRAHGIIVK